MKIHLSFIAFAIELAVSTTFQTGDQRQVKLFADNDTLVIYPLFRMQETKSNPLIIKSKTLPKGKTISV
jgi:hypothetical protein